MGSGSTTPEAIMLAEQEQYTCAQTTIQLPKRVAVTEPVFQPAIEAPVLENSSLFEFAANAPATLAERHPRLTVFAISAAVLLAAVTAEIDCLRGSGYFWR